MWIVRRWIVFNWRWRKTWQHQVRTCRHLVQTALPRTSITTRATHLPNLFAHLARTVPAFTTALASNTTQRTTFPTASRISHCTSLPYLAPRLTDAAPHYLHAPCAGATTRALHTTARLHLHAHSCARICLPLHLFRTLLHYPLTPHTPPRAPHTAPPAAFTHAYFVAHTRTCTCGARRRRRSGRHAGALLRTFLDIAAAYALVRPRIS